MSDTSLRSYRAKRDFTVTTEPPPRDVAPGAEAMFVVQKHTARRAGLHCVARQSKPCRQRQSATHPLVEYL